MDVRDRYLDEYFDQLDPKEFYRYVFPEGELQMKGAEYDHKYNAIAIEVLPEGSKQKVHRYTITDDLDMIDELVQHENFILLSPISYIGKSRESENARFIYALAIDLDGVSQETNLVDLFHQIDVAEYIPRPSIVVNSGNGLHLYYVFEQPLPCFKNIVDQLARLKHGLTKKIWNKYITELSDSVQYQSLFQGFRLVGGVTKNGDRTRAYLTGSRVTVEYLNQFVDQDRQLKEYAYKSKLPLAIAKKKFPKWYQKRIVNGRPRGSWTCHENLYYWWKFRLENEIIEGHRYYGVMCLAVYAKKCGIAREVLEDHAFDIGKELDKFTKNEDNHFTRADVLAALEMYNDSYITFPVRTIGELTGLAMPINKRNGRKRAVHVKYMNLQRAFKVELGECTNGGRPSKEELVREYLERNS